MPLTDLKDDDHGSEASPSETPKIVFKKRKVKSNKRATLIENDDDNSNGEDEATDWETLDALREVQRLNKRVNKGINIEDLNKPNDKLTQKTESTEKKSGGLTDSKTLIENELDLGNTFSIETNRRDEDAELMKYVEEELAKRRQKLSLDSDGKPTNASTSKMNLSDELLLKVIPEHLLRISGEAKDKSEEMLSSQMLSGIPEIDLGLEEKIANIEKTEQARIKLLQQRMKYNQERKEKEEDVSFVPSNLSSCFTRKNQNNTGNQQENHRFNLNSVPIENKDLLAHFTSKDRQLAAELSAQNSRNNKKPVISYDIEPVVVIGAEPQKVMLPKPMDKDRTMPGKDKPHDDYFFEKFRNKVRRK